MILLLLLLFSIFTTKQHVYSFTYRYTHQQIVKVLLQIVVTFGGHWFKCLQSVSPDEMSEKNSKQVKVFVKTEQYLEILNNYSI